MNFSTQKKLLVIGGATASGKTTLAIRLAQHFNTCILSADSRQFYREMSIGTAKPNPDELAEAPHHFINHLSIQQTYSVGHFERDAMKLLTQLFENQDIIILVGGTGLYLRAVCEGIDTLPDTPLSIREKLQQLYETQGIEALQNELRTADPLYFENVDKQNPMRLLRALGVIRATGQSFSSLRTGEPATRFFTPLYLKTEVPRPILYEHINKRVDMMLENGLLQEVENLLPFRHLQALQTVGYQEFFDYFDGKITFEKALELVKQHSRNYAKRQETWFRKSPPQYVPFAPSDWENIAKWVEKF
jgi:tRNA dimethylallyltransferase